MQTCEVLIVGAGFAGASAAYELAPFAKVVLLSAKASRATIPPDAPPPCSRRVTAIA